MQVLLVSHEATRTGAPKVAVRVAESLGASGYRVTTLLRSGGPLRPDFESASAHVVVEPLRRARALIRKRRPKSWIANRLEETIVFAVLARRRPDVVYLNTVKSAC